MRLRLALAFCALAIAGCDSSGRSSVLLSDRDHVPLSQEWDYLKQVDALTNADPEADAVRAFRRGDRYFLAMGGMMVTIPGLAFRADVPEIVAWHRIMGTGGPDAEFNRLAEQYALRYNMKLLVLMQED